MSNGMIAPHIIDNSPERELIGVIKNQLKESKEAKFAIGYFFLSAAEEKEHEKNRNSSYRSN